MTTRWAEALGTLPFMLLLFILPFPGTVSLRLLCLALAFGLAMHGWKRWGTPRFPYKPVLFAWAGVALVSLTYAIEPAYSLGEIKNEVGYTMMAFAAFFAMTRSRARLQAWSVTVLVATMSIGIWALALWHGKADWDDTAGHGGRGGFASLAVVALPLTLLAWQDLGRYGRAALIVADMLILLAAVATEQRILWVVFGVQFAIVVSLLCYCKVLRLRSFMLALLVAASLAAGGAAVLLVHARKVDQSPVEYYDLNNDFRLKQWQKITARISEKPWSGAGFGREAMKKAYPDLVPSTPPMSLLWHPHNVVLTYGIGMGIPGILALLAVFGTLVAGYAGHLHAVQVNQRIVAIVGIAIIAGVLLRNMTNDLFVRDGALMFWALNGAMLGYLSRHTRGGT